MTKTPLQRHLDEEFERTGYNEHSLAIAAGLRKDAIRDIMRGKSGNPRSDTMQKIADCLGRTAAELLSEQPLSGTPEPSKTRLPPQTVEDQIQLQLLRWWSELSERDRRVVLSVSESLIVD